MNESMNVRAKWQENCGVNIIREAGKVILKGIETFHVKIYEYLQECSLKHSVWQPKPGNNLHLCQQGIRETIYGVFTKMEYYTAIKMNELLIHTAT